jgi:hypothetical protein
LSLPSCLFLSCFPSFLFLFRRLRRAIDIPIVSCNVAFIQSLIDEAKGIRGSVLSLDIIQAESFLARFHATVKWSIRAQSIYRGNVARKLFRAIKLQRYNYLKYLRITEKEAIKLSEKIVPTFLEKGLEKILTKRKKSFYSCLINVSGILAIVSIYEGFKEFRKPTNDLCVFCRSRQSTRTTAVGSSSSSSSCSSSSFSSSALVGSKRSEKVSEAEEGEAEAKGEGEEEKENKMFTTRTYQQSKQRRNEKLPCCCNTIISMEKWFFRFYFPLSGEIIEKTYTTHEIRDFILNYEFNKYQFMNYSFLSQFFNSSSTSSSSSKGIARLFESFEPLFRSILDKGREREKVKLSLLAENKDEANQQPSFSEFRLNPFSQINNSNPASGVVTAFSLSPRKRANQASPSLDIEEIKIPSSYSMAWLQTAKESAVLPRLQVTLPEKVKKILKSIDGKKSVFSSHLLTTTGPFTALSYYSFLRNDYNLFETSDGRGVGQLKEPGKLQEQQRRKDDKIWQSTWNWEPFHDLQIMNSVTQFIEKSIEIASNRCDRFSQDLVAKKEEEILLRETRELSAMAYEDKRSQISCGLSVQYDDRHRRNAEIMQFTKSLVETISELEEKKKYDETRSYDGFEDGFQWKEMNLILHLRNAIIHELKALPALRERKKEDETSYLSVADLIEGLEVSLRNAIEDVSYFKEKLEEIQRETTVQVRHLQETMKFFVNLFSFPRKLIPSLGRHLTFFPYQMIFLRDPLERLKKENRKVMTGLLRKAMNLTSSNKAMEKERMGLRKRLRERKMGESRRVASITSDEYLGRKGLDEDSTSVAASLNEVIAEGYENDDLVPLAYTENAVSVSSTVLSSSSAASSSSHYRCVVSVFYDELTGNIVINLSGLSSSTEEGSQHIDLGLEDQPGLFSPLTTFIQPGDIVVTADDILSIIKNPPSYYEEYPERRKKLKEEGNIVLKETDFILPSKRPRSLKFLRIFEEKGRDGGFSSSSSLRNNKKKDNPIQAIIDRMDEKKGDEESVEVKEEVGTGEEKVAAAVEGKQENGSSLDENENEKEKGSRKTKKIASYYNDYLRKERNKTSFAEKLISYLKVSPHTNRPCFGLLSFHRRSDFSSRNWKKCLWSSDILACNPLFLTNQPVSEIVSLSSSSRLGHRCRFSLFEHLHRFEVTIATIYRDYSLHQTNSIEIHSNNILSTFLPSPSSSTSPSPASSSGSSSSFVFLSFLKRLMVGNYHNLSTNIQSTTSTNYPLMDHLLQHLLLKQNGKLTNHMWRSPFISRGMTIDKGGKEGLKGEKGVGGLGEVNVFLFEENPDNLFLSSSHCCLYRFICLKYYCCVKVYENSSSSAFKVEISSPSFHPDSSSFIQHHFPSSYGVIKLYLTKEFIRCLCLKYDCLALLSRESRLEELIQFILDSIEFLDVFNKAEEETKKKLLLNSKKKEEKDEDLSSLNRGGDDDNKEEEPNVETLTGLSSQNLYEIPFFFSSPAAAGNNRPTSALLGDPSSGSSAAASRSTLLRSFLQERGAGVENIRKDGSRAVIVPSKVGSGKKGLFLDLDKLKGFLQLEIAKYNHWVEKRNHIEKHMLIPSQQIEGLLKQIDDFLRSSEWAFKERKVSMGDTSAALSAVSTSIDKVTEKAEETEGKEKNNSVVISTSSFGSKSDAAVVVKQEERIPVFNGLWNFRAVGKAEAGEEESQEVEKEGGSEFMANVSLTIDVKKENLFLMMKESNEEEKGKEFSSFFFDIERSNMLREEKRSQELRRFHLLFRDNASKVKELLHAKKEREERRKALSVAIEERIKEKMKRSSDYERRIRKRRIMQKRLFWSIYCDVYSAKVLSFFSHLFPSLFSSSSSQEQVKDLFLQTLLQWSNNRMKGKGEEEDVESVEIRKEVEEELTKDLDLYQQMFIKRYPLLLSFIQSQLSFLSFDSSSSLSFFRCFSLLPDFPSIEKRSGGGRGKARRIYERSDVLNVNHQHSSFLSSSSSSSHSYRHSHQWFRSEVVISFQPSDDLLLNEEMRKEATISAAETDEEKGLSLFCYDKRSLRLVNHSGFLYPSKPKDEEGERDCETEMGSLFVKKMMISLLGNIELSFFHLQDHRYYSLYLLPSSLALCPSLSSPPSSSADMIPPASSFDNNLILSSLNDPSSSSSSKEVIDDSMISQVSTSFVSIVLINGMMNSILLSYEKEEKARWQEDSLSHVPLVNEEDSFFSSEEKDDSLTTGDDNRRVQQATKPAAREIETKKGDEAIDLREASLHSSVFSVENSLMKEPSTISEDKNSDKEEEEEEEEDEYSEEEEEQTEDVIDQDNQLKEQQKDLEILLLEQSFFCVKAERKSVPLYLSTMKKEKEKEKEKEPETAETRNRLHSVESSSVPVPFIGVSNSRSSLLDGSLVASSSQKERHASIKSKSFISSEGLEKDDDEERDNDNDGQEVLPSMARKMSRRSSQRSPETSNERRTTTGRKAVIRSNPLLRSEVYLFYLSVDEAIEVVLKRIPLNEFLPYLSSSLFQTSPSSSASFSFFDEKVTSLFEKVILYQRKRSSGDEREEKERESTTAKKNEVNQRLKRLLPILLEENPSLSTINNAMNSTNNTRNSMILPPSSTAVAAVAASSNNKFAKILASFNCEGDCILLLRRKEDSSFIEILLSLFRQWERDYLPLLALRQEKAGKEKQWKLSNQEKFTKHILSICSRLLPLTEALFHCHSRNGETFHSSLLSSSSSSSSSAMLSHYYRNEDSILMKFIKLLFYWYDSSLKGKEQEKAKAKGDKGRRYIKQQKQQEGERGNEVKEVLMKMNRGNIPSVFFSSGRNDIDIFLSQFDCRIVDYSLLNDKNLLVNDPYFQYLFLLLQGKVTSPSLSSPASAVSLFDEAILPYDNQLLLSPLHCLCGLYQLHCVSCSLSLSQCSFPHCSLLRSKWRLASSQIEESEGIEVNEKRSMLILQDLIFDFLAKGRDKLEDERAMEGTKAVKTARSSLLSSDLRQDLGITSLKKDSHLLLLTAEEESKEEEKKDQDALIAYQSSLALLSNWKTSQQQIRWLEFLSLFLVSPEILKSGISADDLLSSKGGLLYLQLVKDKEEFLSSIDSMVSLLPFLLIQDSNALSKKKRASSMLRSSFVSKQAKEVSNMIWKLKLPLQILYDVLPIGYSFDPYPSSSSLSSTSTTSLYPLSEEMYSQVMNQLRLSIQVPSLSPYRLFDAGRYSSSSSSVSSPPPLALPVQKEERILSFDRLLTEGIIRASDGKASFLVVQFLYGIFVDDSTLLVHHRNSKSRNSEGRNNGNGSVTDEKEERDLELSIPRAGLRFISIEQLQNEKSSFTRGITALVYDVSSEISRATFLTERQLLKYLDIKGLNREKGRMEVNYHQISQLLLKDASLIIEITRIESYFISASFQFHKLLSQRREVVKAEEENPTMTAPVSSPLMVTVSPTAVKKEIIIQEVTRSSCTIDSRNLTKSLISQFLFKK